MAGVPMHIANLLDKMTSLDKDFRFMATNDLMTELQKDSIKLDDDSEKKVVKMLLKLLADKNGEVQNLAVKCLGPLVNKVKDAQVETIVETLCGNMLAEKEQLRDISSIGLKTVINELPAASSSLAIAICKKLTGPVARQDDVSVQLEILDITSDLLSRFGNVLVAFHPAILQNLLPQLSSPRLAVRKRAIVAISHLANSCNNIVFTDLMNYLVGQLEKNASLSTTRTYIQCLGAITRQAGHRVGEHLDRALPLVTRYCSVRRAVPATEGEDDDELRECCIQSLESFARRCPKDVGPHLEKVISICLTFLVHDPNYSYGDDLDAMDVQGGDDGFGGDDDDDDEGERAGSDSDFSDDDDVSWKVRRASAKCLAAIFSIRHDMLREFYTIVSPALISRFKEREENVKADIFAAYIALLRQTRSTTMVTAEDEMDMGEGPLSLLAGQVPSIVGSVSKLLKEKSIKTKQGCFALLSELVQTLPGALREHVHLITPGLHNSLVDKNSTAIMKIEALSFLNLLLNSHPGHIFGQHLPSLVPPVVACVGDPFYKVASEALLVAQHLARVVRPVDSDQPRVPDNRELSYLHEIFGACQARLVATDVDQEVKERAISCAAQLLCQAVDVLGCERVAACLPVIVVDRLRNETTRLAAARAFMAIASSPLRVEPLSDLLTECVPLLGSFLRKNQRGLRLCSLQCLEALVRNGYAVEANGHVFDATTSDAAHLVCDADLYLAQMALQFLASLCRAGRAQAVTGEGGVLAQVVELVKSPLLQGMALLAVIDLLVALLQAYESDPSSGGGAPVEVLLDMLMKPVYEAADQQQQPFVQPLGASAAAGIPAAANLHKQAYHSIAKCVAALLVACPQSRGPAAIKRVVDSFLAAIKDPGTTRSVQLLAILGLGEIGRSIDLGRRCLDLQSALLDCFSSASDDVKQAAAVAIGAVAVGNLNSMLKFILSEIRSQPTKRQYLLLHSLKEVISSQQQLMHSQKSAAASPVTAHLQQQHGLGPYINQIWDLLMKNCECQEEGTRNVVAECLGRLALLNTQELLPQLRACLNLPSPHARGTAIAAVKFVVSDQPQPYDNLLRQSIGDFLSALKDPDIGVRRVALVTFNSVAHNKPSLMRDLLLEVLPHLYSETKVRKELIREVEMGPFKHTVDDGLDIRKAAFECMYTLLDSCLDRINIFEFLMHVEDGLIDHYDIKMLTYLMLIRLSHLCPVAVLQRLDYVVEALKTTCMSKVRATSVKQEFEKQDELKRSAMRAVAAILVIPDADKNPLLADFLSQIRQNQELSIILDSIKETSGSPTFDTCLMDIS